MSELFVWWCWKIDAPPSVEDLSATTGPFIDSVSLLDVIELVARRAIKKQKRRVMRSPRVIIQSSVFGSD
jgi:hypothetical protein